MAIPPALIWNNRRSAAMLTPSHPVRRRYREARVAGTNIQRHVDATLLHSSREQGVRWTRPGSDGLPKSGAHGVILIGV